MWEHSHLWTSSKMSHMARSSSTSSKTSVMTSSLLVSRSSRERLV
jgi:hypothetical protein